MQSFSDVVTYPNGDVMRGVSVLVKTYPGNAIASLFDINGAVVDNPITTDNNGCYGTNLVNGIYTNSVYSANGRYSTETSGPTISGTITKLDSILLQDMAAPNGAASVGYGSTTVAAQLAISPTLFGQVGTKCHIPHFLDTTNKQSLSQRQHVTFSRLPSRLWNIVVPNFYQVLGGAGEVGSGAVASINAAIEYPKGTTTRVTFSGSNTGSIPNNSYLISDGIPVFIPRGARFWIRLFFQSAGGVIASTGPEGQLDATATGDSTQKAISGLTDTTMTPGVITNTTGAQGYGVCAILAQTTSPSCFAWGDSLVAGTGDSGFPQYTTQGLESSIGAIGYVERALSRRCAYIRCGLPGEFAQNIASGSASYYANRIALSKYCTFVFSEFSSNDLTAGRSAAQIIADINTMCSLFSSLSVPLPVYWGTIQPMGATSSDGYTTYAGQTVASYNGVRTTLNDSLRDGKVSGIAGIFDVASVVEQNRNNGKWKTYPTARILADGTTTSPTSTINSATAAFTIADIGAGIFLGGAGVSGIDLTTRITDVASNGLSCTVHDPSYTSVTNAVLRIGYIAYTLDGSHPCLIGPKSIEESSVFDLTRLGL